MQSSKIEIIPVQSKKEFKQFIQVPYDFYRNDPHWVPPLYLERSELLDPKKNPFFDHAKVMLFLAKKNNKIVGRVSAQVDEEYEKFHKEKIGHFGFFESQNDQNIAKALLEQAENFAKKLGAKRILGPFSLSINEESGMLIDGFDKPLMTMMPYNPPYYPSLIEEAGFKKAKDLFAWHYEVGDLPEAPLQIAHEVMKYPGLTVRPLSKKNFEQDVEKIMQVFNSAWSHNWGFVPLTSKEVKKSAKDLKLFMDPELAFIAEVNGDPAGICLAVPNLYELIKGLNGKLFPFGIFKLLWRVKRKKYKSARLMLLGVKKEYRGSILGGLSILLYIEIHKRGIKQGYDFGELSWTLEDNEKINAGIEFMGGKKYKTYRVYEKSL